MNVETRVEESTRLLLRMERQVGIAPPGAPAHVRVRGYCEPADREPLRFLYAAAFDDEPWPADWDEFDEFTEDGVVVAEIAGEPIGFAISFPRMDHGYISVVAVHPEHRRCGIATSLIAAADTFLQSRGCDRLRIDAFGDSPAAAATYWSMGFRIYEIQLERPGAEP